MAGFEFRYRECGAPPTIITVTAKDTETLTKGDIGNIESGEVDLAATSDAALAGQILETKSHTDSTTTTEIIVDADAVYAVTDANARNIGDSLDISGATGAQTVTTSSNKEFVVVRNSTASEPTLVKINADAHAFAKTV